MQVMFKNIKVLKKFFIGNKIGVSHFMTQYTADLHGIRFPDRWCGTVCFSMKKDSETIKRQISKFNKI